MNWSGASRHDDAMEGRAGRTQPSTATWLNEMQRRPFQFRVFERSSLFAAHLAIRVYGRQYHGYTLKRIAETWRRRRDNRAAAYYARQALGAAPTLKWAASIRPYD